MDDGRFYRFGPELRSDPAARFVRAANWPGFMVGKRPPDPTQLLAELVEAAPEYDTGDCVFCGMPGGHDDGCLIMRAQQALRALATSEQDAPERPEQG